MRALNTTAVTVARRSRRLVLPPLSGGWQNGCATQGDSRTTKSSLLEKLNVFYSGERTTFYPRFRKNSIEFVRKRLVVARRRSENV